MPSLDFSPSELEALASKVKRIREEDRWSFDREIAQELIEWFENSTALDMALEDAHNAGRDAEFFENER